MVVVENCVNLIKEIESYVWDAKKVEKGEDAPLKQFDHCVDNLRYICYSHFGTNTRFVPTKSPHEIWKEQQRREFERNPLGYTGPGWQQFGGAV
jgi:hypothetical protein